MCNCGVNFTNTTSCDNHQVVGESDYNVELIKTIIQVVCDISL